MSVYVCVFIIQQFSFCFFLIDHLYVPKYLKCGRNKTHGVPVILERQVLNACSRKYMK